MSKDNNYENMKKIILDISDKEKKDSNFNGKIRALTTTEFCKENFENKNISLIKKALLQKNVTNSTGIYKTKDHEAIIFLDAYNKINIPNKRTFLFIKTCYHEIRHSIQHQLSPFILEKFACDIDRVIAHFDQLSYSKRHDSFFFEIDANNYSIKKTKEYLKENYPNIYNNEIIQNEINEYTEIYSDDKIYYDIGNSISKTIYLLKKHNISKEEKDEISPILNIFLNDDNTFKTIKEIISNQNFKNIDERIICALFSNLSFLKSLNFNDLNQYEIELLNKVLNYTIKSYAQQQNLLELERLTHKNNLDICLKTEKNILKKISYLYLYISLINNLNKRFPRDIKKYTLEKKKLPVYLERTNSLLKKNQ